MKNIFLRRFNMGFIQAIKGALGGTLADQWKDFYGPIPGVPATAAIFPGFRWVPTIEEEKTTREMTM